MQNYLFPKSGGGWLRRFWQFRSELASQQIFSPDGRPLTPLTIFDFRRPVDRADAATGVVTQASATDSWRISDDRVLGGFSYSSAALIQTRHCWARHLRLQEEEQQPMEAATAVAALEKTSHQQQQTQQAEDPIAPINDPSAVTNEQNEEQNEETEEKKDEDFTPFIRWYGNIDTMLPLSTKAQRSGFSAIRSPDFAFGGADLQGYFNALEIQCRERMPRMWNVQVKVEALVDSDLYQGSIVFAAPPEQLLSAGKNVPEDSRDDPNHNDDDYDRRPFETFVMLLEDLRQTSHGRELEIPRQLEGGIKIQSIGFALMDGVDGPFELDVARVRAVNLLDDSSTVYDESVVLRERDQQQDWKSF